jgi:hypothetical protein
MKADLLKLIAQLTPGLPANTNLNAIIAANTLAQALPSFVRNALGMLGQVSAKPCRAVSRCPTACCCLDGEGDLEHLLRLAAAAVSRLQSHQLSSLEQTGVTDDGRLLSTWQLEIPMRNLQDIVPLQVKFQREEAPKRTATQRTPRRTRAQTATVARRSGVRHGAVGADADSGAADCRQPVEPAVGRAPVHRRPDRKQPVRAASVCWIAG